MVKDKAKTYIKVAIILLVLIGSGVGYWVYVVRMQNLQAPEGTQQSTTFDQTAIPTNRLRQIPSGSCCYAQLGICRSKFVEI